MVKLQSSPFGAALTLLTYETALLGVSLAYGTPHRRRNVARPGRRIGLFHGLPRRLRLPVTLRFGPLQLLGDRDFDDLRQVGVRERL